MTRSIFGKDVGSPVEDAHGADYLVYQNRERGEASALRPRVDAAGHADSRLLRLTTISNWAEPVGKTVIWEACSPSVQADMVHRFGLKAPAQCKWADIEDPRNAIVPAKPSEFVGILNDCRARLGSPVFTDSQTALLTDYVSQIFVRARIKQTHLLIAANYFERLPSEPLQALTQNELGGPGAGDAPGPALKRLIAGTIMLAEAYFSERKRGRNANQWRAITSLPDQHAMLEIFSALGYDASVGEVGNRLDGERPAAIGKACDESTFLPRGSEKRVVKGTSAEIAHSRAERTARGERKSLPSQGARMQHRSAASSRDVSSSSVVHDVTVRDTTRFEQALKQMAAMSREQFEHTYPDPISLVGNVELDRQPQLLLSILQTYVRTRHYPEKPLEAAVRRLWDLSGEHRLGPRARNEIATAAILLQTNLPRGTKKAVLGEVDLLIHAFGARLTENGVFADLRRQKETLRRVESYIRKTKPTEETASDFLVNDLYEIGTILGCAPEVLWEFDNAFGERQSLVRRQTALRAVEQQLTPRVEREIAQRARQGVLAFIAGRVRELRLGLDSFDDLFAPRSPSN